MWSKEVFGETRLGLVTRTVSSFLILCLALVGPQQKPAVPRLRSCDKNREDLRRPPQVHAPHPLRPGREAQPLVTQQQTEWGQRHLFPRRTHRRDPAGHNVREDGVWSVWQDYIQDLCWRQILELHLPGEGGSPPTDFSLMVHLVSKVFTSLTLAWLHYFTAADYWSL